VGIDSDEMVRSSKGEDRPYNPAESRKEFLENIKAVNEVFIFSSHHELEEKIKSLNPDLMVVGSDYKERHVVGSQFAKKLEFFEIRDGYSTTKAIQNLSYR